jgi:hypothetical protein
MMGRFPCVGKKIQVQSVGVAQWRKAGGRCGWMVLLLVLLLGPAAGVAAQQQADQGDPSFLPEVWAGLDGLSKPGRWLTVRAVVANEGPPIDGQLQLTTRVGNDAALYSQRIELATASNGNFWTAQPVTMPLLVKASSCPWDNPMISLSQVGNCNQGGCHGPQDIRVALDE